MYLRDVHLVDFTSYTQIPLVWLQNPVALGYLTGLSMHAVQLSCYIMWFVSIDSWMENCPWSPVDERYWAMLFGINLENAAKLTEMPCAVLKYLFLLFLFFFFFLGNNTEERLCWRWNHVASYWWMWSVHPHSMLKCFSLCYPQCTYHIPLVMQPPWNKCLSGNNCPHKIVKIDWNLKPRYPQGRAGPLLSFCIYLLTGYSQTVTTDANSAENIC